MKYHVLQVLASEPGFILHQYAEDGIQIEDRIFGAVDNEIDMQSVSRPIRRQVLTSLLPEHDTIANADPGREHWLVNAQARECQRLTDLAAAASIVRCAGGVPL